jgi:glutathione reductase (NADPH)
MGAHGIEGDVRLDWKKLIAFKRAFTARIPKLREQALSEQGIHCFHGAARFVAPDTIRVGDRDLKARNILLACGAKPARLSLKGEEYFMTSDTARAPAATTFRS